MIRLSLALTTLTLLLGHLQAEDYDPLESNVARVHFFDETIRDQKRDRIIPVRIYYADSHEKQPVVLWSHGLGGSRGGSAYLGEHWAKRGYIVVSVQHPGSDDSVWRDQPLLKRFNALKDAASAKNFSLRVGDIPAVLNQLEQWDKQPDHRLRDRYDLNHVGMSGHSFGAVTTQSVSGQNYGLLGQRFTDRRIKAAIAMSPSTPRTGNPSTAFSKVSIPWLLMTGTRDTSPIGDQTVESRLAVFPNLSPNIDRYQLLLKDAEHSAFSDRSLPGDQQARNPNHHRSILAISTAFWDAYLKENSDAKQWLNSEQVRSVLDPDDQWEQRLP